MTDPVDDNADRWDLVAAERRALADLLESLTPEQWSTPSLCELWTVKEVAAHLLVGPTATLREFAVAMARDRFNFDRANVRLAVNRARATEDEIVALLREHAESRFTPPGMDWRAPLTDILVHREDIAVPLGLPADRPVEMWRTALDLVTSRAGRDFVHGRLPAVRIVATDTDWSHGDGPEVSGPAAALGTAVTGRSAVLDRLAGDGLTAFADWVRR